MADSSPTIWPVDFRPHPAVAKIARQSEHLRVCRNGLIGSYTPDSVKYRAYSNQADKIERDENKASGNRAPSKIREARDI
jgi:hypothetical protein